MGAMKRLDVCRVELNRAKYARMDALQIEVVVSAAANAAEVQLCKHFKLQGDGAQLYAELYTFIEGQLERLYGE